MKKSFLLLLTLAVVSSCNKNENKKQSETVINEELRDDSGIVKKNTVTTLNGDTTYEQTYGYIAYNGKRASVTFKKNEKENTINILSNGKTFNLDYQKDTKEGQLFSRNGVEAETKGDSLYIRSGATVIELAKVK